MEKIIYYIVIFFFITILGIGCGKDKTPKQAQEVAIGSQSLAETKATFLGNWKLNYTLGGYTGNIKVNYPNTTLLFTATDSLYRWDNNVLTINSKVTYTYEQVYIADYSTFLLEIETPNNLMLTHQIAYKRKGDTLILGQPTSQPNYIYLTKQ